VSGVAAVEERVEQHALLISRLIDAQLCDDT
jgi:hypothetical protein